MNRSVDDDPAVFGVTPGIASRRPWMRWVEIGIGLIALGVLVSPEPRFIVGVWLTALLGAATSLVALLRVDTAATAWTFALVLGRIGLALLPAVVLLRSRPRRRWLWMIPLIGILLIVSTPFSFAACATFDRWLFLAAVSAVASVLCRWRFMDWTIVLPFIVLWEVVPRHGLLNFATIGTENAARREQLLVDCAGHEGSRPDNLTADRIMPYHGVNSIGDDLVLLSGEGPSDGAMRGKTGGRRVGSWWMRRGADGDFHFELPSEATGNLWHGCTFDDTIWMGRNGAVLGAQRLAGGGSSYERVHWVRYPANDIDCGEPACDTKRGRIYVTESLKGGLWELAPDGGEQRRYQVGGVLLLVKRRFDGRLVLSDSSKLTVFDPDTGQVVERVPSRLAGHGFDVCEVDGSAAVADLSGRLRVFTIAPDGRYRFAWGVSLFAPRRVAFSRDCSRIAVTSADDRRVFIVDTATHRMIDVFQAGPALREVATTGLREFSITDVCSMTSYRW